MSDALASRRFRQEREAEWRQLEALLARLERGSLRKLSDAELLALPGLYRAALSSLSVARATSLDHRLVDYLEALSTRAYFLVYGTRSGLGTCLRRFFAVDWPEAARALWRQTLWAWLFTLAGVGLAAYLVSSDPDWFYVLVPGGLADGRDPAASTEVLRRSLYQQHGLGESGAFAASLIAHNTQIAIAAFALGFAFGLPTVILMLYNGAVLGAFVTLFATRGLGWKLAGWLAVHGVTEMMAVALAGAAGLHIGTAIARPGPLSRLDSIAASGRLAATLVAGCAAMLVCAGLLEGVVRQAVTDDVQRGLIGAATLLLWCTYLYRPGKHRR